MCFDPALRLVHDRPVRPSQNTPAAMPLRLPPEGEEVTILDLSIILMTALFGLVLIAAVLPRGSHG